MWICKRILFAPPIARVCFIRRDHTAVTNGGRGLGNLNEEVNQRFRKRTLERLHRWDGMSGNDWFMIYRDNYASRFILLVTMAVPVIGFLTSENCMADVKDGRLWDAFKDTNIVRQMGILVVLPMFSFLLVTYLAWRLNAIRIHRIYVSKKDQKTFTAIISHCGIFTRKILFTKHNVRILESAGHQLWSFVKGSIKINKHRFMLNDESFRDIQCRHLMLGRSIKLPFSADKSSIYGVGSFHKIDCATDIKWKTHIPLAKPYWRRFTLHHKRCQLSSRNMCFTLYDVSFKEDVNDSSNHTTPLI